jgi:hypothetical protein
MAASPLDIAISALENEVSKLEVSIDAIEKWLWISSIAVAVGVALEIFFIVHEHLEDRDAWRRGIVVTPARPSRRILAFEIASVLLVCAGIVGELWVGVISGNKNTELRSKNGRVVSLIREKAGNAETAAGVAILRARQLEVEAEGLRVQAAKLTADNLRARRQLGERRVTDAQRAQFKKLLKPYPGTEVDVYAVLRYDPYAWGEVITFAREIAGALESASLDVRGLAMDECENWKMLQVEGLMVGTVPDRTPGAVVPPKEDAAMRVIFNVLHTPDTYFPPNSPFVLYPLCEPLNLLEMNKWQTRKTDAHIKIFVNAKPQPYLK